MAFHHTSGNFMKYSRMRNWSKTYRKCICHSTFWLGVTDNCTKASCCLASLFVLVSSQLTIKRVPNSIVSWVNRICFCFHQFALFLKVSSRFSVCQIGSSKCRLLLRSATFSGAAETALLSVQRRSIELVQNWNIRREFMKDRFELMSRSFITTWPICGLDTSAFLRWQLWNYSDFERLVFEQRRRFWMVSPSSTKSWGIGSQLLDLSSI